MVSIKDIARHTGYGVSTVSAVLSNKASSLGIKQATCDKITAAAAELGYRRNNIAAQMQSGRSRMLVQFLPDFHGDYLSRSALMANIAALKLGYTTREIVFSRNSDFRKLVDNAIEQRPAAFFAWNIQGPRLEILLHDSRRYKIPLALLDIDVEEADLCVITDDFSGIRQAVDHLYELGHRRIVHATDTLKAQYAKNRFNAYAQCLKEKGLVLDKSLCYHDYLTSNPEKLIEYVKMLTSLREPPTAVTCGSDYIAFKLMMLFPRFGFRVPEDISLIGFGGLPLAKVAVPMLTTIDQSLDRLGANAVETMIRLLNRKSVPARILQPTTLNIAQTTTIPKTGVQV